MIFMKSSYYSAGQYIQRSKDEGVGALMFLLDGIAEEVEDLEVIETQQSKKAKRQTKPKMLKKMGKDKSFNKLYHSSDAEHDGLKRHIIESGKCFGYEGFVTTRSGEKKFPAIAYRAFSNCSIMQLGELEVSGLDEWVKENNTTKKLKYFCRFARHGTASNHHREAPGAQKKAAERIKEKHR